MTLTMLASFRRHPHQKHQTRFVLEEIELWCEGGGPGTNRGLEVPQAGSLKAGKICQNRSHALEEAHTLDFI